MIRSMTGHFSKTYQYETFTYFLSIRSLNHRFLEINFRGNVTWLGIEAELKKLVEERIKRGKVDIMMDFELYDPSKFLIQLNSSLLQKILYSLEPNINKKENVIINMDSLLKLPGVFNINYVDSPFNEEEKKYIFSTFKESLDAIVKEREKEGEKLRKPLTLYMNKLKEKTDKIRELVSLQPERIKKKFEERLKEFYKLKDFSEEKFYEELVYYLDKANINEEIERLEAHISYLKELLGKDYPDPVGRKIGFLMQECLREINTIGSKSQDKEISRLVVEGKELIESIREQIMNIE